MFKSASANVLQRVAFGTAGCGFVEIDWDAEVFPDRFADLVRDGCAIFQRRILEGDEGDHIRGADAWMHSKVTAQIDSVHGYRDGLQCACGDGVGRAGEGDDGTVMIGVHFGSQQDHAGNGSNGMFDGLDDFRVAAF